MNTQINISIIYAEDIKQLLVEAYQDESIGEHERAYRKMQEVQEKAKHIARFAANDLIEKLQRQLEDD